MKLFEIRDPSDYRIGDEQTFGSPSYDDGGDVDPSFPSFQVQDKLGTAPNGEQFNIVMMSSYPVNDKEQFMMWERIKDAIENDPQFGSLELVDQKKTTNGGNAVWYDYYRSPEGITAGDIDSFITDTIDQFATAQ